MKSILQEENECLICLMPNVEEHHVFEGTGRRKISEREGLKIYLCPFHHRIDNTSIHKNRKLELKIKRWAQQVWQEKNKKTKDDFIKLMGKSYL